MRAVPGAFLEPRCEWSSWTTPDAPGRVCATKGVRGEGREWSKENSRPAAGLPRKTDQPCAKRGELYAKQAECATGSQRDVQIWGCGNGDFGVWAVVAEAGGAFFSPRGAKSSVGRAFFSVGGAFFSARRAFFSAGGEILSTRGAFFSVRGAFFSAGRAFFSGGGEILSIRGARMGTNPVRRRRPAPGRPRCAQAFVGAT